MSNLGVVGHLGFDRKWIFYNSAGLREHIT